MSLPIDNEASASPNQNKEEEEDALTTTNNETQEVDYADDDNSPLLPSCKSRRAPFKHKKCCGVTSLITILVLVAIGVATYYIYFHNRVKLHVFAYNVWGMPGGMGGCQYKAERMKALSEIIRSRTPWFDIFLLEELWMQADHELLEAAAKSAGMHMTGFRELASSACDGRVLPTECSGLAVISAFPFNQTEFHQYTWKGTIWDGEDVAGKGVGRVRIIPYGNMTVDIFVTHTIADSGTTMANNTWYRIKQAEELMDTYVKKSTADAVILGGDFNTPPDMTPGTPYEIIQRFMHNSAEQIFSKLKEWLLPKFATYGNQRNTFSFQYEPITYDYIFHKGMNPFTITWTNWFELPFLQTNITKSQREVFISLSDHEPVISTIYVRKWGSSWPYL